MNGGYPLSLRLSSSQSGSQASRLSEGEQSDWVMSQTPVVWSHRLMLCQQPQSLACSTRFLSQTEERTPDPLFFHTFPVFSFSPSTSPVYFNLSNLLVPLCSPIWPSLFTLHFRSPLFPRVIQTLRRWKSHACLQSSLSCPPPLFS